MKLLIAFELPDDLAERAPWLEQQIVGPDLGELVEQLQALRDPHDDELTLEQICQSQLPAVIQSGLFVLDRAKLHLLVCHPRSLLDLQDRVFAGDHPHWPVSTRSAAWEATRDAGWQALTEELRLAARAADQVAVLQKPISTNTSESVPQSRRRWLGLMVGLAAVLLLGVFVWQSQPASTEWAPITAALPSAEVLGRYANAAKQEADDFRQSPATKAATLQRLSRFVVACRRIQTTNHFTLSETDRVFLRDKCKAWADQIDQQIAELQAGKSSVAEVRARSQATLDKLTLALEKRSHEIANR